MPEDHPKQKHNDRSSHTTSDPDNKSSHENKISTAPTLSLPKGGGAIRDIGEKFDVNPATGSASFSVPIAVSPGRSGFGPQLSLAYNSGSGNGPFGLGWSLSVPAISRKTEKGLPRYNDADDSDIFLLSGAEDLVTVFQWDGTSWTKNPQPGSWNGTAYQVQRFRPRVEGMFARIERWSNPLTGDVFWKAINKDNVTSVYGKDPCGQDLNTRIADPLDPTRIFKWLIAETYDDKGNWIVYQYVPEDSNNIDLTQANEANRTEKSRGSQRFLKNILYGNRVSRLTQTDPTQAQWMFQVVLDYGEGHYSETPPDASGNVYAQASASIPAGSVWPVRQDPFSSFRSCFEIRTYRLCRRILMFHHFAELPVNPCLVRSIELNLNENPDLTFLETINQNGFVWQAGPAAYLKKTMPSLEFAYNQPVIDPSLHFVDSNSLENLPEGIDGKSFEWVDLDSEGLSGILAKGESGWYYKRNISAMPVPQSGGDSAYSAQFAPSELVFSQTGLAEAHTQILDLAGDGRKSLVQFRKPVPGYMERSPDGLWESFLAFPSNPNVDWDDPNLKMIDLNGDGFADLLITEDDVLRWYPSFAKGGFGESSSVAKPFDEEEGPALVFADRDQMIFTANMTGDGLTDIVRIRWGEVCYWPNQGYGRFGSKVVMDKAPLFESHEGFNPKRIRLADIDGSGTTDIIYLGDNENTFWFNQAGNSFGPPQSIPQFADTDNLSSVMAVDLLGIGTSCLVWSSSLPGDSGSPLRYIDLMSGKKPHLLVSIDNHIGKKTVIQYSPSTRYYLQDEYSGTPWLTRIPFPVQVVERVDTYDLINHNRFVNRYAYHHGYFDGVEREFRGFGMVEQWDTEEFGALNADGGLPAGGNFDASSNIPPVHTKTWIHTGAYFGGQRLIEGFQKEYFKGDPQAWAQPITQMPVGTTLTDGSTPASLQGTTAHEDREACRALKGRILRQEIYADDGSAQSPYPYSVVDHAYNVEMIQPVLETRHPGLELPHGVFYSYERESISYHYDRNPADPRIGHQLTLAVDGFGNITNSVSIGYGRRLGQTDAGLSTEDQALQTQVWMTYSEDHFTNDLDNPSAYRTPLTSETLEYELTGFQPSGGSPLFVPSDFSANNFQPIAAAVEIPFEQTGGASPAQKRLIKHNRALYRSDDLTGPLPLGTLESMAIPYEGYKMAVTFGLANQVYPNPGNPGQIGDILDLFISATGGYFPDSNTLIGVPPSPHAYTAADGNLWIPSGKAFLSPNAGDTVAQELAYAQQHFFLSLRFLDPFGNITGASYDPHDLLLRQTQDALGNLVTAGIRDTSGNLTQPGNDYRVLQPFQMMDPNRNCTAVAFDALGMVVGTAVMGKPEETLGDSLTGFTSDLTHSLTASHLSSPLTNPGEILQNATTRILYDLFAFQRSEGNPQPFPNVAYKLSRETHVADLGPGQQTLFQHHFSYSDGFGREIQKKILVEPGPLDLSNPASATADPRWVGSGWSVFNNKGKPVRQYEPFFSVTQQFDYAFTAGVSSVFFYDPTQKVVGKLHPNHTFEKTLFNPWRQDTWDVNDTVLITDPGSDPDIGGYFTRILSSDYLPTWYSQRLPGGALGPTEQDAAAKSAVHAGTPSISHFDSLGRVFLTVSQNRFVSGGSTVVEKYETHNQLNIEGKIMGVVDPIGRLVMNYDYDVSGDRIVQSSMEVGARWVLKDVSGKLIYAGDNQGRALLSSYDALHRPTQVVLRQGGVPDLLVQKTIYGESQPAPESNNLRTKTFMVYDSAGTVVSGQYDFKGNLLNGTRQFAVQYKQILDWSGSVALERETFTSQSTYDALNRPLRVITPDQSVILPAYNEAGLLRQLSGNVRGANPASIFISGVDYDAHGRRSSIGYGNGVTAQYAYDPQTFRLIRLTTTRSAASFPGDWPSPSNLPGGVQNLSYTYDPVGNITHIADESQPAVFFQNQKVDAGTDYVYDAIYRLIQATGREHIGQNQALTAFDNWEDAGNLNLPQPGDGTQMGSYTENFRYDPVGNFLSMVHQATGNNWTRNYAYNEPSALEAGKFNNRLSHTQAGGFTFPYTHDDHGNMTTMPHLTLIQWDYRNQLQATAQQAVASGSPETVYYVYDAAGQRIRKVTERQAADGQTPTRMNDRFYLGGVEIYREFDGTGSNLTLERETFHVMDNKSRVALVETRTQGQDASPAQLYRYQLDNHLGSAVLELDDQAQVISYEEYFPYGGTSYQAVGNQTPTPKRYRYTGKERDEETGFSYHGARYYAPWLGRWTACDPAALGEGPNPYLYTRDNPIILVDPDGRDPGPADTLGGRVVALGRTTVDFAGQSFPYMENVVENAAENTGLRPIQFSDILRSNSEARGAWDAIGAGGLPAGYRGLQSGALLQNVLEGVTPVHMDATGVTLLGDTHTSAELRGLITHLDLGENAHQDIFFQEGSNVSRIPAGTSTVLGSPLPARISAAMPNFNARAAASTALSEAAAVVENEVGAVVTTAEQTVATAAPTVRAVTVGTIATGVASGLAHNLIPGYTQAHQFFQLGGHHVVAGQAVRAGRALSTAARAVARPLASAARTVARPVAAAARTVGTAVMSSPVAAGAVVAVAGGVAGGVVGHYVGHAIEDATGSHAAGVTGGTLAGAATGALVGAAIGSVVPVLGTAAGAVIGGVAGAIGGFIGSHWL